MKAYTDIEQSKKLAEILPLESTDMWYWEWPTAPKYNNYEHPMFHKGEDIVNVPCWSLTALLEAIRKKVGCDLSIWDGGYNINVYDLESGKVIAELYSNPVDAVVETIYKLKEKDLL